MSVKAEFHNFLFEHSPHLIDVRSPSEYKKGHIPHAVNYPLFTDEERKCIGIIYKQEGKDKAVIEGFKIVGPRLHTIIEDITKLCPERKLSLHCWRGGMRSQAMSWLLNQAGFNTRVLAGGYKAYRNWVRRLLDEKITFNVLTGSTGSGKTQVIKELESLGEQILDLEDFARHKGSSFGAFGQTEQPSIEHFENLVASKLLTFNWHSPIWVEDESRRIGKIYLHEGLWKNLVEGDYIKISIPLNERIKYLVSEYGSIEISLLAEGIKRIGKRLGPQHLKHAIEALYEGNLEEVVKTCLVYYDKSYAYCLEKKLNKSIKEFSFETLNAQHIAQKIKSPD